MVSVIPGAGSPSSSTGTRQCASTCVATEPITRLPSAPWPCEPISSRSYLPAAANLAIASPAGPTFQLLEARRHEHITPWGGMQPFQFGVFKRIGGAGL